MQQLITKGAHERAHTHQGPWGSPSVATGVSRVPRVCVRGEWRCEGRSDRQGWIELGTPGRGCVARTGERAPAPEGSSEGCRARDCTWNASARAGLVRRGEGSPADMRHHPCCSSGCRGGNHSAELIVAYRNQRTNITRYENKWKHIYIYIYALFVFG